MLTDIYARTVFTATRLDCAPLRDMPPAKPLPQPRSRLGRIKAWLTRRGSQPARRTRCIDPQKI